MNGQMFLKLGKHTREIDVKGQKSIHKRYRESFQINLHKRESKVMGQKSIHKKDRDSLKINLLIDVKIF